MHQVNASSGMYVTGICGDPCLVDIGGNPYLLPVPQKDKVMAILKSEGWYIMLINIQMFGQWKEESKHNVKGYLNQYPANTTL